MGGAVAAFDNVSGLQQRQVVEPEVDFLALTVAEHPGLDDLVGPADVAGDDRPGRLQGLEADGGGQQGADEGECPALAAVGDLGGEVSGTGDGEVGVWRVGDHQVPALVEQFAYVADDVFAFGFGGQQVAAHRTEADTGQGVADAAGEFAGHQGRGALRHGSGLPVEGLVYRHVGRGRPTVVHNVPVLRGAAGGPVFLAVRGRLADPAPSNL